MRFRTVLFLAVASTMLAACAPQAETPAVDLEAEKAAVDSTSQQWLALARAKDAAGIAGLFAADGALFQNNRQPVVGPAAVEAFLSQRFAEDPDDVPQFGSDRIEVAASGDLAVEFGSGGESAKYITVYRKVDGVWKVVGDMVINTAPADTTGM